MAEEPSSYQQLFDPEPTKGHYYSLGSAVLFGGGRLLLLSLRTLGLLAWVVLRRRRGKELHLSRAIWVFLWSKRLFERLERGVDRKFVEDLHEVQSLRDEQVAALDKAAPAPILRPQPGVQLASLQDRLIDRYWGLGPTSQPQEKLPRRRPRCLFLRPFVPDNRFFCELAPFTLADPEPISKEPRLELSLYRLVHGLGGDFVSSGESRAATGSPRRRIEADWQAEIWAELEAADLIFLVPFYTPGTIWEVESIVEGGFLDKTLFLMPPAVLGRGLDQRAEHRGDMLLLFSIALMFFRTYRGMLDADFVTFEYTGRHLKAVLEDPFLREDWEAARESFAALGVTLPPHDPLGALFSFDAPTRPNVKSRLATIYNPANAADEAAGDELAQRLRAFTAETGGNARSLFAALQVAGRGYGHTPGVISAALDVLER